MRLAIYAFFFMFLATAAYAQQPDEGFTDLMQAKSLQCEFGEGYAVSWKSGKPQFESGSMGTVTTFDSIDLKKGTARVIANAGAGDVIVIPTASGLNFMEKTDSGNLVFTTVFYHYASPDIPRYVAVTSRHMDMFGPFPSQYHGTCKIWG
jgi:hypothetical protein